MIDVGSRDGPKNRLIPSRDSEDRCVFGSRRRPAFSLACSSRKRLLWMPTPSTMPSMRTIPNPVARSILSSSSSGSARSARFSPGEIDGKLGENVEKALRAFTEVNGLPSTGKLTPDSGTKLVSTSDRAVLVSYAVTADDLKGPFLERQPASMEAMKDLKALGYRSGKERLAEKFHMSEELLAELNPKPFFPKPAKPSWSPTSKPEKANKQRRSAAPADRLDLRIQFFVFLVQIEIRIFRLSRC